MLNDPQGGSSPTRARRSAAVVIGLVVFTLGLGTFLALAAISAAMGGGGALVSTVCNAMSYSVWPTLVALVLVKIGAPETPLAILVLGALAAVLGASGMAVLGLEDMARWSDDSPWWDRNPGTAGRALLAAGVVAAILSAGVGLWLGQRLSLVAKRPPRASGAAVAVSEADGSDQTTP
jgi:hypothetical protein